MKNRYKVWLIIEDQKLEQDIGDPEAVHGIGYRDTLAEAMELLHSIGRVHSECERGLK